MSHWHLQCLLRTEMLRGGLRTGHVLTGVVPKGAWPRHAHMQNLLDRYHLQTVHQIQSTNRCLTAWARACFEQGALSSILYLPGIVPILSLPGDKMFHTTEISSDSQRPAILHAYGGAKVRMQQGLLQIALDGWLNYR